MGMFDSIWANCPECNKQVQFQSKEGGCSLESYRINSVPPEIGRDLDGAEQACDCGYLITLKLTSPIQRVSLVFAGDEQADDDDGY